MLCVISRMLKLKTREEEKLQIDHQMGRKEMEKKAEKMDNMKITLVLKIDPSVIL